MNFKYIHVLKVFHKVLKLFNKLHGISVKGRQHTLPLPVVHPTRDHGECGNVMTAGGTNYENILFEINIIIKISVPLIRILIQTFSKDDTFKLWTISSSYLSEMPTLFVLCSSLSLNDSSL